MDDLVHETIVLSKKAPADRPQPLEEPPTQALEMSRLEEPVATRSCFHVWGHLEVTSVKLCLHKCVSVSMCQL